MSPAVAAVAQLEAIEPCDLLPAWSEGLTAGEAALVAALARAWPAWVSMVALEAAVPQMDHAVERESNVVNGMVCRVRKKFGADAVETRTGYRRLGAAMARKVRGVLRQAQDEGVRG